MGSIVKKLPSKKVKKFLKYPPKYLFAWWDCCKFVHQFKQTQSDMKIKIELSSKEKVAALGKGVREIAISCGNGGFQRKNAVHPTKNKTIPRKEKYKNPFGE